MSKKKQDVTEQSETLPDDESGRSFGLLAVLAIITIVGVAIWFVASQDESG